LSRQRVSKGQIIQKKENKVASIFSELGIDVTYSEFLKEFQNKYPKDWENVKKRYIEHESLNKPGKSHPMPRPEKYIEMAYTKVRKELGNRSVDEYLMELQAGKPDFYEGEPKNLSRLLVELQDKSDYERRIRAVHAIGKYKSDITINVLVDVVKNDHVFDVQQLAHEKISRFGIKDLDKPKKLPHHSDPEILKKLSSLGFLAENADDKKSLELFISKFKKTYPVDYDLYRYAKRNQFNHWMKSMLKQLR